MPHYADGTECKVGDQVIAPVFNSGGPKAGVNLIAFDRRVFGVNPDDLEECELPSADEPIGAILSVDEARAAVDGVPPGEARFEAVRAAATRSIQERTPKGDA